MCTVITFLLKQCVHTQKKVSKELEKTNNNGYLWSFL